MSDSIVTILYKNADGKQICVEVSTSVKELLEQSDRQIRSQRRQDRRHLSFSVRTDENSSNPSLPTYEDTADLLERLERDAELRKAIAQLTETQKRRLCLYFFEGLSYSEIARLDKVHYRSVMDSVEQALKKLRIRYRQ